MPVRKNPIKHIYTIFNAQVSAESMGGGDKIVLSILSQLQKQGYECDFLGCPEGIGMAKNNLPGSNFTLLNNFTAKKYGFILSYFLRILTSFTVLIHKPKDGAILWSASDFLPDVLPAFLLKLYSNLLSIITFGLMPVPQYFWAGNYFLRARNPFKNEVAKNFSTLFYFFAQQITLFLYKWEGDCVYVLCQEDFDRLSAYFNNHCCVALISGGIDTKFLSSIQPLVDKKYDACFIGRFHYQKGLPILVKVFEETKRQLGGKKKFAIIGWGSKAETDDLLADIKERNLTEEIDLLGFLDGPKKLQVLKSSSVLLFPSNFESWGVVIAEALGCGVPVVAFSLPQIMSNFKKGVLWSNDYNAFVKNTLHVLSDLNQREILSQEALEFSKSLDWEYCAEKFINQIRFKN